MPARMLGASEGAREGGGAALHCRPGGCTRTPSTATADACGQKLLLLQPLWRALHSSGRPPPLLPPAAHPPPPCSFITAFVTLFATVIAITKDLPDVEGDRQHGIRTFATQLGVR